MRLLNVSSLTLKEFIGQVPPYAILSHTWGDDEVLFTDIGTVAAASKQGYPKLAGCCRKAAEDGFEWAWIDTCCIDKSSSAELSEAINSMYKWYQNSTVCYAYLQDVTTETSPPTEDFHITEFCKSRWFTRGWTLQELIAPHIVEVCSKEWTVIGTKRSLASSIEAVTGIPITVLRGANPSTCNIAERMSWASPRTTTREEDLAYCLLGLFNVNMPLLYGEGAKSFVRLQEQILRQEEDYTMFAWSLQHDHPPPSGSGSYATGFLAWSPSQFFKSTTPRPRDLPQEILNHGCLQLDPSEHISGDSSIKYRVIQYKDYGRMFRSYQSLLAMESNLTNPPEFTCRGLRISLPLLVPEDPSLPSIAWLSYETQNSLVCVLIEPGYESSRQIYGRVEPSWLVGVPKSFLPYFRAAELFIRPSGYFTSTNSFVTRPPTELFSSKRLQVSVEAPFLDVVLTYPSDEWMKLQTPIHESPFKALWVNCTHSSQSSLFRIDLMISVEGASCALRELSQSSDEIDESRKNSIFRACAQYKKAFLAHTDRVAKQSSRIPGTVFSALLLRKPSEEDLLIYELRIDTWDMENCPGWVQLSLLQEQKAADDVKTPQ